MIGLQQLVALETKVWQALVDGDPAADAALLSDDFLGVYPTGFSGRDAHADQLAAGPTVTTFEIAEPHLMMIGDAVAMLSYLAHYVRTGSSRPESMYVSSLWCRRDGRWLNVFSQDTPATGAAVV